MWASLGDIRWEYPDSWSSVGHQRRFDYAEHAVIEGKPKLQHVGTGLAELRVELSFDAGRCNPASELERLEAVAAAHQAVPLVFGDGRYLGRFVITDIDQRWEHTDPKGRLLEVGLRVTLKEWADDESETAQPTGAAVSTVSAANTVAVQPTTITPSLDPDSVPTSQITRQG